jgi:hypothetical protein
MRYLDDNLPLTNIKRQVEQADETLRTARLFAKLDAPFGLLAQFLASIAMVIRLCEFKNPRKKV